jgi:hypothetical protein
MNRPASRYLVLLSLTFLWMTGCMQEGTRQPGTALSGTRLASAEQRSSLDQDGPAVVAHLSQRFYDTVATCRGLPALLCSGVLVRATVHSTAYHAWDPNPNNPNGGGVSFSWLRADATFVELARGTGNGFIVLPHFYADDPADGYYQLMALCAFPRDGYTDRRADRGCGYHATNSHSVSGPCQDIGITTAASWTARYGTRPTGPSICGFRISSGTSNSGNIFAQIPVIMRAIAPQPTEGWNEIVIAQWPQSIPRTLPLEAFYYVSGTNGLGSAQYDQKDFYNASGGRWVPVVRVGLPPSPGGGVSFTYAPAEQAIRYPGSR